MTRPSALADVVPDGARPRLHRICDEQVGSDLQGAIGDYKGSIVCDAARRHIAGARGDDSTRWRDAGATCTAASRSEVDFPARVIFARLDPRPLPDRRSRRLPSRKRVVCRDRVDRGPREDQDVDAPKQRSWRRTTSVGHPYTLKNWERRRLRPDPLVWLDNNPTERGLRGPVVGRRNHFGSKSARGQWSPDDIQPRRISEGRPASTRVA